MRNFFIALTRDPISLLGAAITTASALLVATLFSLELFVGLPSSPYIGILAYLILPGIFLLGLLLIPVGVVRYRRHARQVVESGGRKPTFPVIDLNHDRTRRIALTFLVLTLVNIVILATATYKGVEVMESTEFCGETCHSVMEPEHTAYEGSPHARVRCVECHIGPGANWFVKSKLSGAWQVVSTALELYPRPIPTPIHNLRPARETCEQCHWPTKFVGDQLKVITSYANDEENSELKTVLLLRVGGIQGRESQGIHWHVDPNNQIRYRSDETRESIYDVEMQLVDGTRRVFKVGEGANGNAEGEGLAEWRSMDCVDCHNRPTHIYLQPEQAIDEAIRVGRIDRSLPHIRKQGLAALQEEYASHEEAKEGIGSTIRAFYQESHPELAGSEGEAVEQAAQVLGEIYERNVFPDMKVYWGTYPDHIGHQHFPGCFRCHDDEHTADDGRTISQDCDTCHTLLAMEEEDPEILQQLAP